MAFLPWIRADYISQVQALNIRNLKLKFKNYSVEGTIWNSENIWDMVKQNIDKNLIKKWGINLVTYMRNPLA